MVTNTCHLHVGLCCGLDTLWECSLVSEMIENLPEVQETWVPSLGQEDPLEKGMATHSSILAWRIPWTEGWAEVKRLTVTVFLMHVGNF